MSTDDQFSQSIAPVGEISSRTLSQMLGLDHDHMSLVQMRQELEQIRDNELEAEKAVAHVRLK